MNDFHTSLCYWASVSGMFISVYTADTTFSVLTATHHSIFCVRAVFILLNFFSSITAFIINNQVIFLLRMILGKILAKWTQKMTSFYISSSALKLYLLLQVIFCLVFWVWNDVYDSILVYKIDGGEKVLWNSIMIKKRTSFGYIIFFLVE